MYSRKTQKPKISINFRYLFLTLIPIIFIGAIASIPYVYGYLFKQNYLIFISNIAAEHNVTIDVTSYNLGWLNSSIQLTVTPPKSISSTNTITINQVINHGPLVFDPVQNKTVFALASIQSNFHQPSLEKIFSLPSGGAGFLQINSLVSFDYNAANFILTPNFNISIPNVGDISWQGMSGNFYINTLNHVSINSIKMMIKIGALNFTGNSPYNSLQKLLIDTTTFSSNVTIQANKLPIGDSEWMTQSIAIQNGDSSFTMTGLELKKIFGMDGNTFYKTNGQININKIEAPSFAIPIISPVKLTVSTDKLSANGLSSLITMSRSMQAPANATPLQDVVSMLLLPLLTPTTTMSADASANTSLGQFQLTSKLYWPANIPLPKTLNDVQMNGAAIVNIKAAIPLVIAFVDKYADMTPYGQDTGDIDPMPTQTPDASKNVLNDAVADLLQKGAIELPVSLQILEFGNKDANVQTFTADITALKLPKDVTANLVQQFQIQLAKKLAPPPPPVVKLSPVDKLKAQIVQWVQSGYITQDNTSYSTTITRQGGKVLVNGKEWQ